jgi:hypothetical protein
MVWIFALGVIALAVFHKGFRWWGIGLLAVLVIAMA